MVDLLTLTALLPLVGAGGVHLLSLVSSRLNVKRRIVSVVAGVLAIGIAAGVSFLVASSSSGWKLSLSSPYPSLLGESVVEMRWDTALWPLGLSLSVGIGYLLIAALGREGGDTRLTALSLVLLAAGLMALWSANPLTTIVCWALYDLACVSGWIATGGRREYVVRSLALGTSAGLLVWAGALVTEGGIGSVQWALMPAGGAKMTYWMLAGLLRLGAYPLHLCFPHQVRSASPLIGALFLGPVLGWGLWVRLALVSGRALSVGLWPIILALLTLLGGGILGWTASSARASRSWISLGANGVALLATLLMSRRTGGTGMAAGAVVPTMVLGTVAWMQGTVMLFAGEGLDVRQILHRKALLRGIPASIGALSLLGVPATLGFVVESSLLRELVIAGHWGWSVAFFVGQVFLAAAVVRWLLATDVMERQGDDILGEMARSVPVVGLAGTLIAAGLVPNLLLAGFKTLPTPSLLSLLAEPTLLGWLIWGGATLLGGGLAWLGKDLRPKISLWLDAIHDVVLFDWGCELLMGALEQGLRVVRVADDVLGGRGALIWSCLLLLIVILAVGR